jgi:hypothetical protein
MFNENSLPHGVPPSRIKWLYFKEKLKSVVPKVFNYGSKPLYPRYLTIAGTYGYSSPQNLINERTFHR